ARVGRPRPRRWRGVQGIPPNYRDIDAVMRILIVDDEAPLRHSLSLLLAESGYQVEAEGSPVQALARARAEAFDLILCDVRMPEMDGLTSLRKYRADGGGAMLVMMSAYGGEDAALEAM